MGSRAMQARRRGRASPGIGRPAPVRVPGLRLYGAARGKGQRQARVATVILRRTGIGCMTGLFRDRRGC